MAAATADLEADIQKRTVEKTKLDSDLNFANQELQVVRSYRQTLESQLTKLRSELSALYKANRRLVAQLTAASARLTERARRMRAAAVSSAR